MYHLTIIYPRGRMMTFSNADYEDALKLFSDVVNDEQVLQLTLFGFGDDQNTMFKHLLEIYQNREILPNGGFRRWLNHPHAKLQYYNGYVDPDEFYDTE